jgi:hypothetical protein
MQITGYPHASDALKKSPGLTNSPVAIRHEGRDPPGVEKLDTTVRHCQMVSLALQSPVVSAGPLCNGDRDIVPALLPCFLHKRVTDPGYSHSTHDREDLRLAHSIHQPV